MSGVISASSLIAAGALNASRSGESAQQANGLPRNLFAGPTAGGGGGIGKMVKKALQAQSNRSASAPAGASVMANGPSTMLTGSSSNGGSTMLGG